MQQMPPAPLTPSDNRKIVLGVFIIVAISLAVPAYFIFWPEYQRTQLIEHGLPAEGTILSIQPTGSTFNDQPEVRIRLSVMPPEGESYEAETTMIINAVYIPQFQPGMKVKVRYDANDRSKVAIEETENGQR